MTKMDLIIENGRIVTANFEGMSTSNQVKLQGLGIWIPRLKTELTRPVCW